MNCSKKINPKTLLKQALLFRDEMPQYSRIELFYAQALDYQALMGSLFISAKSRQTTKILDWDGFFEFLSDRVVNKTIASFEDIDAYLELPEDRADAIERRGDSKSSYVKVFDKTLLIKRNMMPAQLFTADNSVELGNFDPLLAIENAETFLTIAKSRYDFSCDNYLYLGGQPNELTRNFIRDKEVLFFVDFDIVSMNIYEDFDCREKALFIPDDIENYFTNYPNKELYKKQRHLLRDSYQDDAQKIIDLICNYSAVVEQEVIR